jgi:hypothetical protein
MTSSVPDELLAVLAELPEDRVRQVLEFAQFLHWRTQSPDEYYGWAEGLAQAKGFYSLAEADVVRMVRKVRSE